MGGMIRKIMVGLIASFFALIGAYWVVVGFLITLSRSAPMIIFSSLLLMLFGVMHIVASFGALARRLWGRSLIIIMSAVNAVWWTCVGIFPLATVYMKPQSISFKELEDAGAAAAPLFSIVAALCVLSCIYLLLPKTKQLFVNKAEETSPGQTTNTAP